jgi:hypothetical protein
MGNQEKDIFNIHLNKEGADLILRFCKIVQSIVLIGVISGFISILHHVIRIDSYNPALYATRPYLKYEYTYHPYFWIFYDVLWMVQLYFYFRFRNGIKKAVDTINTDEFNNSFSYLYRMSKLTLALLIINLISLGYSLFLHFKYPV